MTVPDGETAPSAPPPVPATGAQPERLGRALTASYAQAAITLLLAFVSTPLYLRLLGTEMYGLWMTASSTLSYLGLSGLGFPQACANRIAEAYGQNRPELAGRLVITAAWMTVCVGLLALTAAAGLTWAGVLTPSLFKGSDAVRQALLPVIFIVAGGYFIVQPFEQFRGAFRSFQRVALEQVISTGQRVAGFALGVAVLMAGGGVIALAASQAVTGVCGGLIFCALFTLGFPAARVRATSFSPALAREVFSPSVHFLIISVSGALIWGTDNLVIASFLGTGAVTTYAVSMRLLTMASSVIAVGLNVLHPSTTLLWATGRERGELARRLLLVTRVITTAVGLLVIEYALLGREFIALWAGRDAVVPDRVFFVLIAIFALRSFAQCFEVLLLASSRHHGYAYIVLAEGVLNVALSVTLVRHLGLLGVALGTLLAHMCASGWFLPLQGMRLAGLRLGTVAARALAPLAVPALAAGALTWGISRALPTGVWWSWLLRATACAIVYLALYAVLALDARERADIAHRIADHWRRTPTGDI